MNKRITGFIIALISLIVLAACGSSEETVSYQAEEEGVKITLTYTAEDDTVTEQTSENEIEYAALGLTDKEQAEEIFNPVVEQYQNVDGITHEIDYQDDKVVESVSVDLTTVDMDELTALEGAMFEPGENDEISLERSVEMIESQGFEKVE